MRTHSAASLVGVVLLGTLCLLVADGAQADLLVSSDPGNIRVYSFSGEYLGDFTTGGPTMDGPARVRFGPDGNLYVLSSSDTVIRFDGTTGAYIDTFIATGSNGLDEAKDMVFGPDGNLYISANEDCGCPCAPPLVGEGGHIMRFNGTTGAYIDDFVGNGDGSGGTAVLSEAMALVFGPDGSLYVGNDAECVTTTDTYNVLRFNGTTGAFIEVFVPDDDQGLHDPNGMVFGPDGNLYIAEEEIPESPSPAGRVLRYNGTTGAFMGAFVTSGSGGLWEPEGLEWGPEGDLYVCSGDSGEVYRYDGSTGDFIDVFVPNGRGGLADPKGLVFTAAWSSPGIPTLGQWSMIVFFCILLGFGWLYLRGRSRRQPAAGV